MSEAMQGMPVDGVTAGMLLRQAREAAGLHVETLAVSLKVPVRKLEALEEDRYDLLGDAVFVRALASTVCRTLKVDAQPVLERLPQSGAPRLVQDKEGLNAPFRAPGDGPPPSWIQQLARPVPLAVGALLLGALVIALLPGVRREEAATTAISEPAMPADAPAAAAPAAEPAPASAAVPVPAAGMVTTPVATPVLVTPAPAPAASAAPVATAPATAASATTTVSATATTAAPPVSAAGIVVFKAKGQSWVQVTDSAGNAVLRRLMEPGETAGASGSLPLSVTVGSVRDTEVMVRGKPYNLAAVARDNVARFEVK